MFLFLLWLLRQYDITLFLLHIALLAIAQQSLPYFCIRLGIHASALLMKKLITISVVICSIGLMAAGINLNLLDNYGNQPYPSYIRKGNTLNTFLITDEGATLGRVLFYDKKLSANNTVACGSCHHQQFAFGDTAVQSKGVYGAPTTRHAMRLINTRFGRAQNFFWDQRADGLEAQSTQPVRNHIEMGFSGTNSDPDFDSLIRKLQPIPYYQVLFRLAFGDTLITEERIQGALAQFVRSILSFDSKYDSGRALVGNDQPPFPNFTAQENQGKDLFMLSPGLSGAGCIACHHAPLFDIDPGSRNNNTVSVAGQPDSIDITVTRAPSLRDIVGPSGNLNTPLMHDGSIASLAALIEHYDSIVANPANTNLDRQLTGQNLHLDQAKKDALMAFLKTLTGSNIYTDRKWSDPFEPNGDLNLIPLATIVEQKAAFEAALYPNPTVAKVNISLPSGRYLLDIYDGAGRILQTQQIHAAQSIDLSAFPNGLLQFRITDLSSGRAIVKLVTKVAG
jgi:cytochrome c peroxidase